MQPRWTNIVIFLLTLVALVLMLAFGRKMVGFVSSIQDLGPGYCSPQDKFVGMIALGFVAACFLAVLKVLLRDRNQP